MAIAKMKIGFLYTKKGFPDSARKSELEAHQYAVEEKSTELMSKSYNYLGITSAEAGNYKEAIAYYEKALKFHTKDLGADKIPYQSIYRNLAVSYGDLNKFDSANKYDQLALYREKLAKDTLNQVLSYENIAINYINQANFKASLSLLDSAERLLRLKENEELHAFLFQAYGYHYFLLKDYPKSIPYGEKSLVLLRKSKYEGRLSDLFGILAEDYYHTHQYAKGYQYLLEKIKVDSLLDKKAKIEEIKNLSLRYDLKIKQKNIQQLEVRSHQQRKFAILIAALCLLLLFVIISFILGYGKIKLLNQQLITQNLEIHQKNEDLDRLNSTKNKLFSIVSHDLKGPFYLIKKLLPSIKSRSLSSATLDTLLDNFNENMELTIGHIDNILIWSNSQLEGFVLKPTHIEVKELLSKILKSFTHLINDKELFIVESLPQNPVFLLADYDCIQIALRNLLDNAIKFSNKGSKIEVSVCQKLATESVIRISIRNFGQAIPPEYKNQLFNTIGLNKQGTNGEKGYGLGLYLSSDLIRRNKGTMTFTSDDESGTCFSISLPGV